MNKVNIIAEKVLLDAIKLSGITNVQLPNIELATVEVSGAGILGKADMPSTGQVGGMSVILTTKGISKEEALLLKSGIRKLEVRYARDVVTDTGEMDVEGVKIFINGVLKKYEPGKVEVGASMEGTVEYEITRYRQVVDGVETILIDKFNCIFKIDGVDQMAKVKSLL